ncbi:hypothetical protein KQX54_002153 [Cotesia glomerata]|uniref:Uncharacterized protein n=1 Tax=Cotesia glomerata TaxID=32391 RepID=A0AAV7IVW5_COTGL|nr:hypothetical protein KQX54_002153 [Cotesia glomerata]
MEKWLQKKQHQQFDGSAIDKDRENEDKNNYETDLTCSESDSEVNLKFKDWIRKSSIKPNAAYCKICLTDIVCYNKNCLSRHYKSSKHISNMETIENKASQQKIDNLIQDLPLNKQIKRAELILAATVAVKCLSFSLMDTLIPIISKIFPDSKIAKQLSLKRTKTTAVIHSLSTVLLEDLNEKLMKPGSFFFLLLWMNQLMLIILSNVLF